MLRFLVRGRERQPALSRIVDWFDKVSKSAHVLTRGLVDVCEQFVNTLEAVMAPGTYQTRAPPLLTAFCQNLFGMSASEFTRHIPPLVRVPEHFPLLRLTPSLDRFRAHSVRPHLCALPGSPESCARPSVGCTHESACTERAVRSACGKCKIHAARLVALSDKLGAARCCM